MGLFCCGKAVDTSREKFGELRQANLLADRNALKRSMEDDGYLFFRGLIAPDEVIEARREILLKYAIIGEIDNINHPLLDGIQQQQTFTNQVNLVAFAESVRTGLAYQNVVSNRNLISFYEDFLGGEVRCFDFKWPRFIRPGEGSGIHADIVYVGRGTKNVWSSWIPLGDVRKEDGALIVLEHSHKSDKLLDYWAKDADRDKLGRLSSDTESLQEALGGRWLSADFCAGDVLCFSTRLVHASLDNHSPVNRVRLTSDSRYQLVSESFDERWNGDISNPHGGRPKVFMPGLIRGSNNLKLEGDWKPIDKCGRLLYEEESYA